jgi:hypothetical protein
MYLRDQGTAGSIPISSCYNRTLLKFMRLGQKSVASITPACSIAIHWFKHQIRVFLRNDLYSQLLAGNAGTLRIVWRSTGLHWKFSRGSRILKAKSGVPLFAGIAINLVASWNSSGRLTFLSSRKGDRTDDHSSRIEKDGGKIN